MRVNLGSGLAYLDGWTNVDSDPGTWPDVQSNAFDFIERRGGEITELYMGHFLEHIMPDDARTLLALIARRLPPDAEVSAVVPDMQAIFGAYLAGEIGNNELNAAYVYSYVQASKHLWCYDASSLRDLFEKAGFEEVRRIDPLTWPPVYWKTGQESRWQCGVRATVPTVPRQESAEPSSTLTPHHSPLIAEGPDLSKAPRKVLLGRMDHLRRELEHLRAEFDNQAARQLPAAEKAAETERELAEIRQQLQLITRSGSFAIGQRVWTVAQRVLPPGTSRRGAAKRAFALVRNVRSVLRDQGLSQAPSVRTYPEWHRSHDASTAEIRRQRETSRSITHPVGFSAIVFADGNLAAVGDTVRSLQAQSWPLWKAVIVTGSTMQAARWQLTEGRLRVHRAPRPAEAANEISRSLSPTEFSVFLWAGDRLAPDCLYRAALAARRDPLIDLLYWDDDLVQGKASRDDPRFRPSWSPEMLLSANYIGSAFALRNRRFLAAGGIQTDDDDVMLWDLLLRSRLSSDSVERIPRVLSHVTRRREGTPGGGLRIVNDFLSQITPPSTAGLEAGRIRVRPASDSLPHVTVIIPTRHNRPMLLRSLGSLAKTEYPSFDVIVMDNGSRAQNKERWYTETFRELDLTVEWWEGPFNYSAVNNWAAQRSRGEVLIFLNDDTEILDPTWMRELVGWATRDEIGAVGLQLVRDDGTLQHAGAILGLNGFADHIFEGMRAGAPSLLGSTGWYRNVVAVTGACLAIRRSVFHAVGGFDERFVLCGSDVALGLDLRQRGLRNLCSPFAAVAHLGSATRGTQIPAEDFHTSYWRYQAGLFGGDPYFSPNLSLTSRIPELRFPDSPSPLDLVAGPLNRPMQVFRQRSGTEDAFKLARFGGTAERDARSVRELHEKNQEPFAPKTINWFIPGLDSPFYGGINTAFRIADYLARHHGMENRFVVWDSGPTEFIRTGIAAAFPSLHASAIVLYQDEQRIPAADIAVATLWVTAYMVARFPHARRKFYLIQDFEPIFYPGGSLYALTEGTYRLGLYGLCNTETLRSLYEHEYGGKAMGFIPAVDRSVFHAEGRAPKAEDAPVTIFVYARPGHWRNCWELASMALRQVKDRLGDRVRIVAAGSWAIPDDPLEQAAIKHMGLLDYKATGTLYRSCEVGLTLAVSKHPSYLPLELMACGVPVVAFDNPAGYWLLRHGETSLLTERSVDAIAGALEQLVSDGDLRTQLAERSRALIAANHSSWEEALSGVYAFLADPEGDGKRARSSWPLDSLRVPLAADEESTAARKT